MSDDDGQEPRLWGFKRSQRPEGMDAPPAFVKLECETPGCLGGFVADVFEVTALGYDARCWKCGRQNHYDASDPGIVGLARWLLSTVSLDDLRNLEPALQRAAAAKDPREALRVSIANSPAWPSGSASGRTATRRGRSSTGS